MSILAITEAGKLDTCEQLGALIRHAISEGHYPSHAPLPSYRELSKRYGVSVRVVWDAMALLEQEGLVYRMERRGTFVRGSKRRETGGTNTLRCVNFVEDQPAQPEHNKVDYLTAYTDVLEPYDIKTRFIVCPEDGESYERLLSDVVADEAQGCVLVNRTRPALLRWLNDRNITFVVQFYIPYSREGLPPHHSVFINKTGGAFKAARHLLDQGHRRIGFIGALPGGTLPAAVFEGYRAAMACAALTPQPYDMLDVATDDLSVALAPVAEFLKHPSRPTAILTQTDTLAIAVLRAAKSLGVKVPDELSVVGFNDQPEAAKTDPKLTTLAVPRRTLARKAVELLLDAKAGKFASYQTCILECSLVLRESTARPARVES